MLLRCVCGGGDVTLVCVCVIQVWGGLCMLLRCVYGGCVCYSGVDMGEVYVAQVCMWGQCMLLRCVCGNYVCYSGVYVGIVDVVQMFI